MSAMIVQWQYAISLLRGMEHFKLVCLNPLRVTPYSGIHFFIQLCNKVVNVVAHAGASKCLAYMPSYR